MDNVETDLGKVGWGNVGWIGLALVKEFYFCEVHPVALLTHKLPKYALAIATDNLYLLYSVCSLHVSAPTGHLQEKHNNIYIFIYKNHHTTAHQLCYNYSPIWCTSLIIYLSTLQSHNGNSLIK
jgi:hypothetical protein